MVEGGFLTRNTYQCVYLAGDGTLEKILFVAVDNAEAVKHTMEWFREPAVVSLRRIAHGNDEELWGKDKESVLWSKEGF